MRKHLRWAALLALVAAAPLAAQENPAALVVRLQGEDFLVRCFCFTELLLGFVNGGHPHETGDRIRLFGKQGLKLFHCLLGSSG